MKTQEEFRQLVLPKWPAIVISGETITPEQAEKVFLRTELIPLSTNNNKFAKSFYKLFGFQYKDYDEIFKISEKIREIFKTLELEYLDNCSICSCFMYGPYSWCHLDGKIGMSGKNIGKWPSVIEIEKEWNLIAEAFPFLSLECELYGKESCEEDNFPIIRFIVNNGKVTLDEPIGIKTDLNISKNMRVSNDDEIGISIKTLKKIFKRNGILT